MNKEDIVEIIRAYVLKHSDKDDIHGFRHTERVYELCLNLGKKLNANLHILKIIALLHDIGRYSETYSLERKNHAEVSAQMALKLLNGLNTNLTKEEIHNIIHSIKAHSFSNNIIPDTLEAKILSDVDKLDALGAIGLYRTIAFTVKNRGEINQVIDHLESKILKLKSQMYLKYSKKLATKKEKIIFEFYNKIKKEK